MIATEHSWEATSASRNGPEVEWIAPDPHPIGAVPQKKPPEIESIAPVTKLIATPTDLIAREIDFIGTETELIASEAKN